jgi:hypothetical protein
VHIDKAGRATPAAWDPLAEFFRKHL